MIMTHGHTNLKNSSCQFTNTDVIISLIEAVFISEQANVIVIDTSLFACTIFMPCVRYFLPYKVMVTDAEVTVTNIKIQKVKSTEEVLCVCVGVGKATG
jgi:hypothetical protein